MPTLREIFSDIADAIRTKTGKSVGIYPVDMASEIERIESGGDYKLEKMPSGAISSFNDGAALPLNNLKISIEPVQSGSGDPSPTNIRPISGWYEVKVTVADDVENPTVSNVYTIDLDGTRYGGELDVVSGVLTVDRVKWTLTPTANQITGVNINDCIISIPSDKMPVDWNVNVNKCMCNKLKVSNYSAQHDNHVHFPNTSMIALFLSNEVGTTKQAWIDYLAQEQIEISYLVATPQTYQLNPTAVKSLLGTNNIWADTGDIIEGEYFKGAESESIYYIKNIRIKCEVI